MLMSEATFFTAILVWPAISWRRETEQSMKWQDPSRLNFDSPKEVSYADLVALPQKVVLVFSFNI